MRGLLSTPHAVLTIDEYDGIECMSCHEMYSGKSIEKVAVDRGTDCHHENVYKCYTCHS